MSSTEPTDADLNAALRGSVALARAGVLGDVVRVKTADRDRDEARARLLGMREATESYAATLVRILAPRLAEAGGSLDLLAKAGEEMDQIDEALRTVSRRTA